MERGNFTPTYHITSDQQLENVIIGGTDPGASFCHVELNVFDSIICVSFHNIDSFTKVKDEHVCENLMDYFRGHVQVTHPKLPIKPEHTDLQKHVIEWINNHPDYISFKGLMKDLMQCGAEGMPVHHLQTYSDCRIFVQQHEEDIGELVNEWADEGWNILCFLFGDTDKYNDFKFKPAFHFDVFYSKLARAAFEETARNLAIEAGVDV